MSDEHPDADENKEVSYFLAESYREEGDIERADAAYETYIQSQGRSQAAFQARLDRATMWLDAGEVELAREAFALVREKGRSEAQRFEASLSLAENP